MKRGRPIAAGGRSARAASAKALLAVPGRSPVAFAQGKVHGGETRLQSALGKGSTFTVVLPLRQ
jgi:hypothetical protein